MTHADDVRLPEDVAAVAPALGSTYVIADEIGRRGMATGTDLYVVDLKKTILSSLRRFAFRRG